VDPVTGAGAAEVVGAAVGEETKVAKVVGEIEAEVEVGVGAIMKRVRA